MSFGKGGGLPAPDGKTPPDNAEFQEGAAPPDDVKPSNDAVPPDDKKPEGKPEKTDFPDGDKPAAPSGNAAASATERNPVNEVVTYVKPVDLYGYLNKDMSVLELACGSGQLSFPLSKNVNHWTATDFSEKMIEQAKRRGTEENLSFCLMNMQRIPDRRNLISIYGENNFMR